MSNQPTDRVVFESNEGTVSTNGRGQYSLHMPDTQKIDTIAMIRVMAIAIEQERTAIDAWSNRAGDWHELLMKAGASASTEGVINRVPEAIESMAREIERLRTACATQNYNIEQTLGKALGYPRYGDLSGPTGDHEADDEVFTGEHIAETLAMEAVKEIERLRAEIDKLTDMLVDRDPTFEYPFNPGGDSG